jgi:hypothetical protein
MQSSALVRFPLRTLLEGTIANWNDLRTGSGTGRKHLDCVSLLSAGLHPLLADCGPFRRLCTWKLSLFSIFEYRHCSAPKKHASASSSRRSDLKHYAAHFSMRLFRCWSLPVAATLVQDYAQAPTTKIQPHRCKHQYQSFHIQPCHSAASGIRILAWPCELNDCACSTARISAQACAKGIPTSRPRQRGSMREHKKINKGHDFLLAGAAIPRPPRWSTRGIAGPP